MLHIGWKWRSQCIHGLIWLYGNSWHLWSVSNCGLGHCICVKETKVIQQETALLHENKKMLC